MSTKFTTKAAIPSGILKAYGMREESVEVEVLGKGNINDTFLASSSNQRTVFQKISSVVFPKPTEVAANFQYVSTHIHRRKKKIDPDYQCARLIPTRQGKGWHIDEDGECWRVQEYVDHTPVDGAPLSYDKAVQLGRVLGRFHRLTEDLDVNKLYEPIPGFHRTLRYLENFDKAIQGRQVTDSTLLSQCVEYVDKYRGTAEILERERASGNLAVRVMHGDPKVDNIIWSKTGRAEGLFDLDTVGPGLRLYDLGDCLRSSCNIIGEEAKPGEVAFAAEVFQALLEGYFSVGDHFLSRIEKQLIVDAALTITLELGVRFLTDYLSGDVYFKTSRTAQNLDRALVQFHLADSIKSQEIRLRDLTNPTDS